MPTMQQLIAMLRDKQFQQDMTGGTTDALNRGIVASALGGPADMGNTLLNLGKAGYGAAGHALGLLKPEDMPELDEKPFLGSEWWGDKMQGAGMVSGNRNPTAEMIAGGVLGPAGGAQLATKAPQIAAMANRAAENIRAPRQAGFAAPQRGGVDVGPQKMTGPQTKLKGMEMDVHKRLAQAEADYARTDADWVPQEEADAALANLNRLRQEAFQARQAERRAGIQTLRAGRSPTEPLDASLTRETTLLEDKLGDDTFDPAAIRRQREIVRELRGAQEEMNYQPPAPPQPAWAANLTELPSSRYGQAPAGSDWWHKEFDIDPTAPPASIKAFLDAIRDNESAFEYGTMPKNAYGIEDFADEFGKRAGKRIHVSESDSDNYNDYDEPYKIEVEKTHGRGEVMRDRYGDYKQEKKLHDAGDMPVYDDQGNVKKVKVGLDEKGKPIKEKYEAQGGEIVREPRDRWGGGGSPKYRYIKSEGGEPMRDERGNRKYTEEENPDYNPPEPGGELRLSTNDGEIKVSDWGGDEPQTYAMDAGKSGALLYQTLLAHASKDGIRLGGGSLTGDNAFRMLSNTLSNAARTGTNPRSLGGTSSGARPRARGFATGDRIWQAETGESEARLGRSGADPNELAFTGTGFTHRGQPLDAKAIADQIREFSPEVGKTKVGPKSVMRGAVYRWLENATPEQAGEAARNWDRIGKPLFGAAGTGVGTAAIVKALREREEEGMQ